jgi:hypothetical protein
MLRWGAVGDKVNVVCFIVFLSMSMLVIGCSHQQESERLLASVNNSNLYMRDVERHVDTASAYAVRSYVSNWVNQELLYDEAEKEGLDEDPEFKEKVKEFSRQLAITMLLNKKVYSVPIELTSEDISNYYAAHREEFRAASEMACVSLAAFSKRSFAVAFRNALVSGTKWSVIFNDIPTYAVLDVKDSVYLTSSTANSAIWAVVQSLGDGGVSFPIQVDTLSYVVQVKRRFGVGEPLPLDYATPMIRERLIIEKRRQLYRRLLDSLRSIGNFRIDPSVAIEDTSFRE